MVIRTKIIATIGPASGDVKTIRRLLEAGCDVFRINFSHGDEEKRAEFLQNIRAVEAETGQSAAVMADLCGPKIRAGLIEGGSVLLADGQDLDIVRGQVEGNADRISTTLDELIDAASVGEPILLDDGKLRMEVVETHAPEKISCRVVVGGVLASGKGVNLPATNLKLSSLTQKDRRDAKWIAKRDFDYVALSFVRSAKDIAALRSVLKKAGSEARIIAKIEKPQAIEHIEDIVHEADGVMVARGDLGVEMQLPAVPVAQKRIADLCLRVGKCCIIATQMLESMTQSPTPTRAEVSDVANAVLDHTDAVMLSGETAVGKYPDLAVKMMNDTVAEVQAYHDEQPDTPRVEFRPAPTVAAIASAVREIIATDRIAAVATFTLSGTTALVLAKSRLTVPVLALSPNIGTVRRMCLYYGVEAVQASAPEHTRGVLEVASEFAVRSNIAKPGDKIVVISGRPIDKPHTANTLVVHTIE